MLRKAFDRHRLAGNRVVSAVLVCAAMLCTAVPLAAQEKSSAPRGPALDRQDDETDAYLRSLDAQDSEALRDALKMHFRGFNGAEHPSAIPSYEVYHAVFLRMLTQPELMYALPDDDRSVIESLPAHDDPVFLVPLGADMGRSCDPQGQRERASREGLELALHAHQRVARAMAQRYDNHYQDVIGRLSEDGRQHVITMAQQMLASGELFYAELDLVSLSFSFPDFVSVFLKDSCRNSRDLLSADDAAPRLLRDSLNKDFQDAKVEIYVPR